MHVVRRSSAQGLLLVLVLPLLAACATDARPPTSRADGTTTATTTTTTTEQAVASLAAVPGGTFTSEVLLTGSTVTDRGKFRTDPAAVAFTRVLDVPGSGATFKFRVVGDDGWLLVARSGGVRTPQADRCWIHGDPAELAAGGGLPAAVAVPLTAEGGPGARATADLYPVAAMLGARFAEALGVTSVSTDRVELDLQVADGTVTGWTTTVRDIAAATEAMGGEAAVGAEGTITATVTAADRAPRVVAPPASSTVELPGGPDALADAGTACADR